MTRDEKTQDTPREAGLGTTTLLDVAKGLIYGDRAAAYGPYENEAVRLAKMWGAFLRVEILPEQVPAMLVILKLARLSHDPTHEDSWVDIAGYAGCAGKMPSIRDDAARHQDAITAEWAAAEKTR